MRGERGLAVLGDHGHSSPLCALVLVALRFSALPVLGQDRVPMVVREECVCGAGSFLCRRIRQTCKEVARIDCRMADGVPQAEVTTVGRCCNVLE
jgi:hypothetical protein